MSMVTLLYPPQQTHPSHPCKPEASLAYPYLAGALRDAGHRVTIYDACVGNDRDPLDVFYSSSELDSGLRRYGVSDERILEEVADSDVVGITSIFTAQETMAIRIGRLIKERFPNKLLITGGTNARSRPDVFLTASFDVVCMSEAEQLIVQIADHPEHYRQRGLVTQPVLGDLDRLPIPAWDLHANERYWEIGRPHGAAVDNGSPFRYGNMMTSRGCVFCCRFCHISGEPEIGRFRVKSIARVQSELDRLQAIGVTDLFIEDDTLFGRKRRAIELLHQISVSSFRLWGINGINLCHLFHHGQPDTKVLDVMQACDFEAISLPVESASQRLVDYYASSKWRIDRYDVAALIRALSERGISAGVNYMIGYPNETLEEIQTTVDMARRHMAAGAASANFMLVMPLPGTLLHQEAIEQGYLDEGFNPDTFTWRQTTMKNTTVPPEQLLEIHQAAWAELN